MESKTKRTFWTILGLLTVSFAVWMGTNQQEPLIESRLLQTYQTSSTRTSTVDKLCSGFTRAELSQGTGMSSYVSDITSDIGINGYITFNIEHISWIKLFTIMAMESAIKSGTTLNS